jgi:hypothetical protein
MTELAVMVDDAGSDLGHAGVRFVDLLAPGSLAHDLLTTWAAAGLASCLVLVVSALWLLERHEVRADRRAARDCGAGWFWEPIQPDPGPADIGALCQPDHPPVGLSGRPRPVDRHATAKSLTPTRRIA